MHNIYFDGRPILKRGCLFNQLLGQRNVGKTYWCKKEWMIDGFLKDGGEFVYLRRHEADIESADLDKFFSDIRHCYPDHQLSREGKTFLMDDKPMGYALALSTAGRKKGIPHPKVTRLLYDEYLPDDVYNGYLKNEVDLFFQLYLTLSRLQLIEGEYSMNEIICFFTGNFVTEVSPYFYDERFGLKIPEKGTIYKNGESLLCIIKNEPHSQAMLNQRIGKVLAKSSYGQYAFENTVLRDSDTFIEKISGNVKPIFNLHYMGDLYGVWESTSKGLFWVSPKTDPAVKIEYSVTMGDHSYNTLLFKNLRKAPQLEMFVKYYKAGKVRFVNQKCKAVMYEMIKQTI